VERTGVYKDYVTCPTGIAEEIGFFARGIERSTGRSLYDERISVAEVDLFAGICVPNNGFSLDVARQTLQAVQDVESYRHLMPRLSSDLTFIEE
jgi:hypothetical protein